MHPSLFTQLLSADPRDPTSPVTTQNTRTSDAGYKADADGECDELVTGVLSFASTVTTKYHSSMRISDGDLGRSTTLIGNRIKLVSFR
jgi:hypothetical protein